MYCYVTTTFLCSVVPDLLEPYCAEHCVNVLCSVIIYTMYN